MLSCNAKAAKTSLKLFIPVTEFLEPVSAAHVAQSAALLVCPGSCTSPCNNRQHSLSAFIYVFLVASGQQLSNDQFLATIDSVKRELMTVKRTE